MKTILLLFLIACAGYGQNPSWSPRLIKSENIATAKLYLKVPSTNPDASEGSLLIAEYRFDEDGKVISEFRPNGIITSGAGTFDYSRQISYQEGKVLQVVERGFETQVCTFRHEDDREIQICRGPDGERKSITITEKGPGGKPLKVRTVDFLQSPGNFVVTEQVWTYKTGESLAKSTRNEISPVGPHAGTIRESEDIGEVDQALIAIAAHIVRPSLFAETWEDRYLTDRRGNVLSHWSGTSKLGENKFEYDSNGLLQKMFLWVYDGFDQVDMVYEKR